MNGKLVRNKRQVRAETRPLPLPYATGLPHLS